MPTENTPLNVAREIAKKIVAEQGYAPDTAKIGASVLDMIIADIVRVFAKNELHSPPTPEDNQRESARVDELIKDSEEQRNKLRAEIERLVERIGEEAWQHAACLSIAEGQIDCEEFTDAVVQSPAMRAVLKLRRDFLALRETLVSVTSKKTGQAPPAVSRCETCAAPKVSDLNKLWESGPLPQIPKTKKVYDPLQAEMARQISFMRQPWWKRAKHRVGAWLGRLGRAVEVKEEPVSRRHEGATDDCLTGSASVTTDGHGHFHDPGMRNHRSRENPWTARTCRREGRSDQPRPRRRRGQDARQRWADLLPGIPAGREFPPAEERGRGRSVDARLPAV